MEPKEKVTFIGVCCVCEQSVWSNQQHLGHVANSYNPNTKKVIVRSMHVICRDIWNAAMDEKYKV